MTISIIIENENQLSFIQANGVFYYESERHERFRALKDQCGFDVTCVAILTYFPPDEYDEDGQPVKMSLEIKPENTVIIDGVLVYGEMSYEDASPIALNS